MKNLLGFIGKIDARKGLGILTFGMNIGLSLLNGKTQANERKILKDELKKEILEELLKEKN